MPQLGLPRGFGEPAHLFAGKKGTLANISREQGKETNLGNQGTWKF